MYSTFDSSYCVISGAGSDINGYYSGLGPVFLRRDSDTHGAIPDSFMLQQWKPDFRRYQGPLLGKSKTVWELIVMRTALYVLPDTSTHKLPTDYEDHWATLTGVSPAPHIVRCSGFVDYNPPIPENPKTNFEIMTAQPVTMVVLFLIIGYGYYLWNYRIDVDSVSCSYQRVVVEKQYYRVFTSSFAHVDLMHIGFNLMTLYQFGTVETYVVGSFNYAYSSLNLIVWTIILLLAMQYAHAKYVNDLTMLTHSGIGYSCVLFAWMVVASVKMDKFCPIFFLPDFCFTTMFVANSRYFPVNFGPVVLLIATKFVLPRSSFLGHLSGLLLGFPLAWNYLDGFTTPMLMAFSVVTIVWVEGLYTFPASGGGSSFGAGIIDSIGALWEDMCAAVRPGELSAVVSTRRQMRQLLVNMSLIHDPNVVDDSQLARIRTIVNGINRNRLSFLKLFSNSARLLKTTWLLMLLVTLVLTCVVWAGVVNGLIRLGVVSILFACTYLYDLDVLRYYRKCVQSQLVLLGHLPSPADLNTGTCAGTVDAVVEEAREYQICQLLVLVMCTSLCMFIYDCANCGCLLTSIELLVSNSEYRDATQSDNTVLSYQMRCYVGIGCYSVLAMLELLLVSLAGVCLKTICANDSRDSDFNPNVIYVRSVVTPLGLYSDSFLLKLETAIKQMSVGPSYSIRMSAFSSYTEWFGGSGAHNHQSYQLVETIDSDNVYDDLPDLGGASAAADIEMSGSSQHHVDGLFASAHLSASSSRVGSSSVDVGSGGRVSAATAARNAALKRYENKT